MKFNILKEKVIDDFVGYEVVIKTMRGDADYFFTIPVRFTTEIGLMEHLIRTLQAIQSDSCSRFDENSIWDDYEGTKEWRMWFLEDELEDLNEEEEGILSSILNKPIYFGDRVFPPSWGSCEYANYIDHLDGFKVEFVDRGVRHPVEVID